MTYALVSYRAIRAAVALSLLLLAASPCTAPFVTFDPVPDAPAATLEGGKAKTSKDGPVTVPSLHELRHIGDAFAVPLSAASPARDFLRARHDVLRL
jgi:hypothetical protein